MEKESSDSIKNFYKTGDVAKILSVTEKTVRHWADTNLIPSIRIGHHRLISKDYIRQKLEESLNVTDKDKINK